MTAPSTLPQVTLFFSSGTSDKEYRAWIAEKDGGYLVNFAYGRRGSALKTGTKTPTPLDYAAATGEFDKLVSSKTSKGYTPEESGTPYLHSDNDKTVSGLLPQLLNVADESGARTAVSDDRWCLQEKFDGRRMMVRRSAGQAEAINKLGPVVGIAATVADALNALDSDAVLDGEIIGGKLHVFDILELDGQDLRDRPYHERYAALTALVGDDSPHLTAVTSWTGAGDKGQQLDALKARGAEGVVFKNLDAPYTVGRPNSGGTQLKFKFVETLSALVTSVNNKRSVGLSLHGDDGSTFVGNVTIPANHDIPASGAVVEVRYLYAAPMLVQPVYLGVRDDVEQHECVMSQVKFKTA